MVHLESLHEPRTSNLQTGHEGSSASPTSTGIMEDVAAAIEPSWGSKSIASLSRSSRKRISEERRWRGAGDEAGSQW